MGPGGYPGPPGLGPPAGTGPGWYPPSAPLPGLASWSTRAGGLLIDTALVLMAVVPLYLLGLEAAFFTDLGAIAAVAAGVFLAVQVGQTGQSPGMRVVGVRCLGVATGQPIGAGLGVVRSLAHFIDSLICYVGWLFPLWDAKRQTIADKVVSTVVVSVPKLGLTLTPPPG